MNVVWFQLLLVIICVQYCFGFRCYHCHQTSKRCNNGDLDEIHQKNCSQRRCTVMKYETPVPGRKVLATIRDCASSSEQDLVQMVSVELKTPAKVLVFEECFTSLCNFSTKPISSSLTSTIVLIFLVFLFS